MLTLTDVIRYGEFKPYSWHQDIQRSFENLIDLIELRVERDGVKEAMHSLLDKVFELRMKIIPVVLEEKSQEDFLNFVLDRQLALKDESSDYHDNLYAEILVILHQICYQHLQALSPRLKNYGSQIEKGAKDQSAIPSLLAYRTALQYSGAPKEVYNLLEASLKADFNGILYELLKNKRLPSLGKHKKEIVQEAFIHTEEFGFYSALLNLWKPSENKEHHLLRNIKIRLALHQLNQSPQQMPWEPEEVKDFILQ